MRQPTDPAANNTPNQRTTFRYLKNLEQYVADGKKADILYDHQKAIITDTLAFLRSGNLRGHVEAPTGTGKTVLFVALAEAFSYKAEKPPKILVVTPTKDLVRQTVGGSENDKGFAGFAPDMSVGTFYSDTSPEMRSLQAQVTVTTYASLGRLANMATTTIDEAGEKHIKLRNLIDETFDIIFLDEGHKALGTRSREIVTNINPETLIIGFTATPDYHASRSLESLLPTLIHRLDLKESIALGILSPVIPIAIPAPSSLTREFLLSSVGEYEATSLRQLIHDESRNQMIVSIAAELIQAGNTPIISCIPGEAMAHPHMIAEMLGARYVDDENGVPRPIRAKAITSSISAAARQKIYAELERGEIDALTYINVLTEGWDSQRANVIINARPTRSLVSARQRTGRILRNKASKRPAMAIDIVDPVSASTAPQVSMADIFTLKTIRSGSAIGDINPQHTETFAVTIEKLTQSYGVIENIKNSYTEYVEYLESLPQLSRGYASIKQDGKIRTFASARRLRSRLNIDSFALEYIKKHFDIETRMARRHQEAVEAYDEEQIQGYLASLPVAAHTGQGLRVGETSYVSLDELVSIARRKHPRADASYEMIEAIAHEVVKDENDLHFTKRFRARTHRGIVLYTAQTMVSVTAGQSIIASLDPDDEVA